MDEGTVLILPLKVKTSQLCLPGWTTTDNWALLCLYDTDITLIAREHCAFARIGEAIVPIYRPVLTARIFM